MNDRIFQIKDLAKVAAVPKKKPLSLANGEKAVTLAVIKQVDENMTWERGACRGY